MDTQIEILNVEPSELCPDIEGAVDADVEVTLESGRAIKGGVTLVPSEQDADELVSWGDLSHWVTPSLYGLDREDLDEIEALVARAGKRLTQGEE